MDFTTLIVAEELLQHLENPDWAIFDVRFDLNAKGKGLQEYLESHIPGAIYAHLEKDLSLPASTQGGRHPLPPVEALAQTFSRWGIDDEVQVVAYDDRGGGFAARLWWTLRYLGHNQVALLDGGFPAWVQDGLPTREGEEKRAPRHFEARVQDWMLVDAQDVLQSLDDDETLLIDSRAPERYQGLEEPIDRLAGHIPSAANRFWQNNLDERGKFLPKETLQKEWEQILKGISSRETIVHCGSGVTACLNIFAMTYAGFEGARLYAGSWSQWLEDPDLPKFLGHDEKALPGEPE
jgi:thiosulfate/3-mercaptopyruvate sulfurtransferase